MGETMERFDYRSGRDPLTGLLDMHSFIKEALSRGRALAQKGILKAFVPVYFNVNNFQQYNNLHGIKAGDQCLVRIARILEEVFPGCLISRQGGDMFLVLAREETVIADVEEACVKVNDYINLPSVSFKAGLRPFDREEEGEDHLSLAFDQAKLACESIKTDMTQMWAYYVPAMGKQLAERNYVLENFDRALEQGYLKVFYQPVVRTVTGKICGAEALSRWIDPDFGTIRPDVFIKVLEEARVIHRLDSYVLDTTIRQIRQAMDEGRPLVPISINFSRLDFTLMEPFREVETKVAEAGIPRRLIRIEITESALLEDKSVLMRAISNFRDTGYQVWLDDFGSGYSSLNVLQNYHVDELKIDMAFLRNFSEESRKIIKSIVLMAKTLGTHTLAEGVETRDQADFLNEVGCEKIQGFYYGRPMPIEEVSAFVRESGLKVESREEEQMMDQAGLVNLLSDTPTGLLLYDGEKVQLLHENAAFRAALRSVGTPDRETANRNLLSCAHPQNHLFVSLCQETIRRGEGSLNYLDDGQYMRMILHSVASDGRCHIFKAELYNLDAQTIRQKSAAYYDRQLRNLTVLYSGVFYLDLAADRAEVLQSYMDSFQSGQQFDGLRRMADFYARKYLHPDDRDRFASFMRVEEIYRLAGQSQSSEAINLFRERQKDGSWRWKVFDCLVLFKQKKDILLFVREDALSRMESCAEVGKAYLRSLGLDRQEA